MSEVDAARYMGIGQEPAYGNAAVLDDTAVSGAPFTMDRDVAEPSILEIIHTGITTGGDVLIPGTINGATHLDTLTLPTGDGVVTGVEVFQGLDLSAGAVTIAGGLAGGTITIRVSTQEFHDFVDESVKAKQGTMTTEDRVRARFYQFDKPGQFEVGGDINSLGEPEGGFPRLLKWALCRVTTTAVGGASVLAAIAIAATHTFDNDIVPNENGGDKRLLIIVTGTAVAGTVTIPGTVNASVDTDVVVLNSTVGFSIATVKAFDSLDLTAGAIATTGLTGGTISIVQVDAYDHILQPGGIAPSFFARIGVDGVWEKEVQGLVVEALQIVFGAGKWVRTKLTVNGRTEAELQAIQAPSFRDLEPFDTNAATITRDIGSGAEAYDIIMEATFDVGNNPSKDRFAMDGGRFRRLQPWQGGNADLTLKLLFQETAAGKTADEEYRNFWGSTTAKGPEAAATPWNLNMLWKSGIPIYAGGEEYEIALEVPTGIVDEFSSPVSKRDVMEQEVAIKIRNEPDVGYPFRVRVRNGQMEF